MPDPRLERLARSREELDQLGRRLSKAERAARVDHTGADGTGTVAVTVDGSGQVSVVRLERDWRTEIGVDRLTAALQAAIQAATQARTITAVEDLRRSEERPPPPVEPLPSLRESLGGQLAAWIDGPPETDEVRTALAELAALLESLDQAMDEATAQMQARLAAQHVGRSRGRHVSVVLSGSGALIDVRFDQRWLVNAHEFNISRELVEAFRAAYDLVGRITPAELVANTALGEFQRLSADPAQLMEQLTRRRR